jgi:hypothetical protein
MRRWYAVLSLATVLFFAIPVDAACKYFQCRITETGEATCYNFWCSSSGCNEADFFAEACPIVCDRGGTGGGCWCEPQGMCFDI